MIKKGVARIALVACLGLAVAPVAMVAGCQTMQTKAPTYAQSVTQAYNTLEAVRTFLAGMVRRDRLPIEQVISARDSMNEIEQVLDIISVKPDAQSLEQLQKKLLEIERDLTAKDKS